MADPIRINVQSGFARNIAIRLFEKTATQVVVTLFDKLSEAKNVTGFAFRFSVSETRDSAPLFTKDTSAGIVITTPNPAVLTIDWDETDLVLPAGNDGKEAFYELVEYSAGNLSGPETDRAQGPAPTEDAIYEP